jgi:hypothetical protein
MNAFTLGLILSLSKLMTVSLNVSFLTSYLISVQSNFFALPVIRAMTGSIASYTFSGGFARFFNSFKLSLVIPDTLSYAAINAGSALPKSFFT